MAWTDWSDDETVGYAGLKCFHCKKAIAPGAAAVLRRGTFDGKPGMSVSLHAGDCANAGLAFDSDDEAAPKPDTADQAPAAAAPADPDEAKKLEHYAEIRRRNDAVLLKYSEWDAAHAHAASLKKELESMRKDLNEYIRRGNDPQRPLGFDDDEDPATTKPAADEPAWKARPLSELMLSKAMIERLAEAGITTLGHLKDFWDAGQVLTSIKGIGAEKNGEIADAWGEYAKTHQEVYGVATDDDDDHDPFAGDEPAAHDPTDDDGPEGADED